MRPKHAPDRDERGMSLAVWATLAMPAFVIAVGLGVDFAGHATAEQECRAVAREAARSAGQQVVSDLDGTPRLDTGAAKAAARAMLDAEGYGGNIEIGGTTITVNASGEYDTLFLGVVGVDRLPVHGTGTADVARAFQGQRR